MHNSETNAAMDVPAELKGLRLHGMAGAWVDLAEQGGSAGLDTSRWLLEHLLQAETTDRLMRSVSYQMSAAKFPAHRDMAGFDFESYWTGHTLLCVTEEMQASHSSGLLSRQLGSFFLDRRR